MVIRIQDAIVKLQKHEADSGSAEVQICLLTAKLARLSDYSRANPKDVCAKRKLKQRADERRAFLKYLVRKNPERYELVRQMLGIRKLVVQ